MGRLRGDDDVARADLLVTRADDQVGAVGPDVVHAAAHARPFAELAAQRRRQLPRVIVLPIDADKLAVRPLLRDEVLYVSADPERTRRPATIHRLAAAPLVFYDAEAAEDDPIRRQLAERAQALASGSSRRSRSR